MRTLLFANTEWYLYNFRLSLINALRDRGDEIVLLSPPGPYGEKLRALGFQWTPAPMDRLSLNPCLKYGVHYRLLWDKGILEFVKAARLLKHADRKIDFLLAGDPDPGNPAAVPVQTINGWVAEGLVQWLGHVDDMPTLFNTVDVVVLPSYREGLPKGLIEAGACGVSLITSDVPGCREVVTHNVDGLLVPSKNSESLALAIGRLQDDVDLRIRLGRAARAKVLDEFDEKIVIRRTLAVYQEVIGTA